VNGMVSKSEPPRVSSRKKEPKMLTGSELRSARMLHSHPSWANRPSVLGRGLHHSVTHTKHDKSVSLPRG
jgi:hypothetical protein